MEQKLIARGLKPRHMRLDNEASQLLKDYLFEKNISFQLVPPYCHHRKAAESAIQTFKDHLIAGLCCAILKLMYLLSVLTNNSRRARMQQMLPIISRVLEQLFKFLLSDPMLIAMTVISAYFRETEENA
jgi:hypothetical protein